MRLTGLLLYNQMLTHDFCSVRRASAVDSGHLHYLSQLLYQRGQLILQAHDET